MRSTVKWKTIGDKCIVEFFKGIRQKDLATIIFVLRDNRGKEISNQNDLSRI